MCYWVLKENGQVIACSTVHTLFEDEIHSKSEKQKHDHFDKAAADVIRDFDSELILEMPNDELKELLKGKIPKNLGEKPMIM